MRLQPPLDWTQEEMNLEEFRVYLFKHRIIDRVGEVNLMDYIRMIRPNYPSIRACISDLMQLFPLDYQPIAYRILMDELGERPKSD
jgi:hypothetical protein